MGITVSDRQLRVLANVDRVKHMETYTQWWIAHPWHVTKGMAVPPDCDCEYCRERRDKAAATGEVKE